MRHFNTVCLVADDAEVLYTWCIRLGRAMFYDADEADAYTDRAYRLCLLGCPCTTHQALDLPPKGEGFVARPADRRRMTAALESAKADSGAVWSDVVRRRVFDVLRDALGDTPRLRAANTSFTGRPERVLAEVSMTVGAQEVMRKIILGATGWRHSVPLAFFTGRCDTRTAAAYVVDSVRVSRRPSTAGANFVDSVSVTQIQEFLREGRAAIIAQKPTRWAQLITECAAWSARSLGSSAVDDGAGSEDRQQMRQVDGTPGYLDPADIVSGADGPVLSHPVDVAEDSPIAAVLEHLVEGVDRGVRAVVDWLCGDVDAAPTSVLVGWIDAARHGRKRRPAHRALRAASADRLPMLLSHARGFLRASQPAYWALLVQRAHLAAGR